MTPFNAGQAQECVRCDADIPIGNEAVKHIDGFFCSWDCLRDYLEEGSGAVEVYLTDDKKF